MSTRASRSRASVLPSAAVAPPAAVAPIKENSTSRKKRASVAASPARRAPSTKRVSSKRVASPAARRASKSPAGKKRSTRRGVAIPVEEAEEEEDVAMPTTNKKKRTTKKSSRAAVDMDIEDDVTLPSSPAPKKSSKKKRATTTKKSPARRSPAKRVASPAKRVASPAKRAASPAKRAASRAASPAKRAASPAKRTASPKAKRARSPSAAVADKATPKKAKVSRTRSNSPAAAPASPASVASKRSRRSTSRKPAPTTPRAAEPVNQISEDVEEDENIDLSANGVVVHEALPTPPPAAEFSDKPARGGLGYMPRISSYPSTPKATGVSTLLTALADVPVPKAIFMSPFHKLDDRQLDERRYGGSRPNEDGEGTTRSLAYDESDSDHEEEEESDEVADLGASTSTTSFRAAREKVDKVLRPTLLQQQAERAKVARDQPRQQQDTPILSRARSRLAPNPPQDELNANRLAIKEEDDDSTSDAREESIADVLAARRRSLKVDTQQRQGTSSAGGFIPPSSSPFLWIVVGILLIASAQFLTIGASTLQTSNVGRQLLERPILLVENETNRFVSNYVRPYLQQYPQVTPFLPTVRLNGLVSLILNNSNLVWILVPSLYLLASIFIKCGYSLTPKDVDGLSIDSADRSNIANARHARHVFVAAHAFCAALSTWIFVMASESFPIVTQVEVGQVAPLAFSFDWVRTFLILTSFSWSLVEVFIFPYEFSQLHLSIWSLMLIFSEAAYFKLFFPTNISNFITSFAPTIVIGTMTKGVAMIPSAMVTSALTLPLLVVQIGESVKALGGVAFRWIGLLLIFAVPAIYAYGMQVIFANVENCPFWLHGLIFLAAIGATTAWEIIHHLEEIQVPRFNVY